MTQALRPTGAALSTTGAWTGAATDIDEGTPSDTDYVATTPDANTSYSRVIKYSLRDATTAQPGLVPVAGSWQLVFRGGASNANAKARVRILADTTPIYTREFLVGPDAWPAATPKTFTLDIGDLSGSIGDPTDLAVELAAGWTFNGGSGAEVRFSSVRLNVPDGVAAPSGTFVSDETEVYTSQPVTLTWNISDATSITASGGSFSGSKSATGEEEVTESDAGDYTYTLTAVGVGGTTPFTVGVTVNPAIMPTGAFTSDKSGVYTGNSITLTWTSDNAITVVGSGPGFAGSKSTSGSQVVTLSTPGTYVFQLVLTGVLPSLVLTKEITIIVRDEPVISTTESSVELSQLISNYDPDVVTVPFTSDGTELSSDSTLALRHDPERFINWMIDDLSIRVGESGEYPDAGLYQELEAVMMQIDTSVVVRNQSQSGTTTKKGRRSLIIRVLTYLIENLENDDTSLDTDYTQTVADARRLLTRLTTGKLSHVRVNGIEQTVSVTKKLFADTAGSIYDLILPLLPTLD